MDVNDRAAAALRDCPFVDFPRVLRQPVGLSDGLLHYLGITQAYGPRDVFMPLVVATEGVAAGVGAVVRGAFLFPGVAPDPGTSAVAPVGPGHPPVASFAPAESVQAARTRDVAAVARGWL
jgi:hypothetical protein